jgi:hypothetical protein
MINEPRYSQRLRHSLHDWRIKYMHGLAKAVSRPRSLETVARANRYTFYAMSLPSLNIGILVYEE